jgi:hypothetical protein
VSTRATTAAGPGDPQLGLSDGGQADTQVRHPASGRATGPAVAAMLVGACTHLYLQVQMLLTLPKFSFHSFKQFYPYDQLSYLGIALNVANGHSGSTEPFTETGVSHYPRLYYVVMGLLARASGIDPVLMWWLMGLALQFVLACFIGWALYVVTRRWWAAVLAPLPFLVGTFAAVLNGSFFSRTPGGAVLWGPFALLFPLNGGTAGVSLAACAVVGLLMAGWGGFRPRPTMLAGIFAAVCLGLVGNMQTYSFIGLCYILLYSTALYGLQSQQGPHRRWLLPLISAGLLAGVLLLGNLLAAGLGPLPLFVLGLLPALPGYLVLCRQTSWRLLWVTLLGAALALPTTLSTLLGVVQGDPFLVYRQSSTAAQGSLGVPLTSFLGHGAVGIGMLLILALVPHAKSRLIRSYAVGAFLTWSLLSFNDHWGPSQEPNRFWIDQFMVVLVTGFPLLFGVTVGFLSEAGQASRSRRHTAVAALTGLSLIAWTITAGISARDWRVFNDVARTKGVTSWPSDRADAIKSLVSRMPLGTMVTPDRCTDPMELKAITGARVAMFNSGLAWPDHRSELVTLRADRAADRLSPQVALRAGAGYLLTDSPCSFPAGAGGKVRLVGSSSYVDAAGHSARLQLWKITA